MTFVPVQLPAGIARANTPYDTTNQWWDTNLVRWQAGTMLPVGGNVRLTQTPLDSTVRKIFPYRDNANDKLTLVGTNAKLYTDQGGYVDITPSGFVPLSTIGALGGYGTLAYGASSYGTARPTPSPVYSPYAYWTMSNWGQDVVLTANSDGRLFYYTSSTPTVAPALVSTAPTGIQSVVVTDERHVMVCGYNDGTTEQTRSVAWCSREDYTDWNFESTTNTAGFLPLSTRSPLLKAVKVREGVLVFSYSDIFLGQYVGTPYVYGFQRLSETEMMHPDGIATFNGKAVWLSKTGFQIYSGGFVQPLECPFLESIFAEMDPTYGQFSIHASHNGVYPEVWFFYATAGNTTPNRYVMWNYVENWWARGFMSRTAMSPAEIYKYPYAGDAAGNMFQQETGYTDNGVSRVGRVYAETGALGVGNGDQLIEIKQVLPATGVGAGALEIEFFTRQTPEGAERTFGPYPVRADGYADVRVTGREARIRLTAAQDGPFGIGKMRFDVTSGAKR